jgi:hypothetical protein
MGAMNTIGKNIYEGIKPSGATSIQGWNSTKGLFAELIERVRPATIIEVGTWLGASAIHMAGLCRSLGLPTKIYCVDTWLGAGEFWNENWNQPAHDLRLKNGYPSVYYEFLANVVQHGFEDTIIPVPNTSFIGSCIFRHRHILADLIYIDGSHAYEDVKSDIAAYRELLTPGGVIFGDDIGWHEVKRAVSESIPNHLERDNFWLMP